MFAVMRFSCDHSFSSPFVNVGLFLCDSAVTRMIEEGAVKTHRECVGELG